MKRKILTLEDASSFRDLNRLALEAEGFEVIEAQKGASFTDLVRALKPDLIVLDAHLTSADSLTICRSILADQQIRHIPVVMLSSSDDSAILNAGFQAGAKGYLCKPFYPRELVALVKRLTSPSAASSLPPAAPGTRASAPAASTAPTASIGAGPAAAKPLVLAVDDSREILRLMEVILGAEGYEVMLATDGMTALRLAKTYAPQLILLDLHMPKLDGYQVCRMLKENQDTQDIPVIFVTGDNDPEVELRSFGLGGADHIEKPFNRNTLLARVRSHIGQYRKRKSLQRMFDDVIEFAPDAYLLTDVNGDIAHVNACAEMLFGFSQQELLGTPLHQLIPGLLISGQSVVQCQHKDGSFFSADMTATTLRAEGGTCQMAVLREASVQRHAQEAPPVADASDPMLLLSERERQITALLVSGASVNAIAFELCISNKTVSTHKIRILRKLNVTNVPDLVRLSFAKQRMN